MLGISLEGNKVLVRISRCSPSAFSDARIKLRSKRFHYNSSTSAWEAPYFYYPEIKEALEDIDTIDDLVDKEAYDKLSEGTPEQEISPVRRIPDYSLMNYPPKEGKHPYEQFQHLGVTVGINKSRYAYFWEMGTGKSYVAACIIAHRLLKYHDVGKVVFMTTNIGVRNLKNELCKFIKGLDEDKIVIANKDYRNPFDDKSHDIVLTSYNSFRLICDYYKKHQKDKSKRDVQKPKAPFLPIKEWADGKDCLLILDESHEIMNSSSQRGYYVALHSSLFRYRYLFTGTPADSPDKLYNQFKTLDPWLVYGLSFTDWKRRMAVLGGKYSEYEISEWKRDELEKSNKRFLSSYGNYYKTTDVIELPENIEKKIYLTMQPKHRAIYETLVLEDLGKTMRGQTSNSTRNVVNRFPFMMLAVDDPELLKKHSEKFSDKLNKMLNSFKFDYLEKVLAIEDIIADYPDEKIILWAIHPHTIYTLGERFKKLNPTCITGDTPQEERHGMVESFKKDPKKKLLIANITTLNTSETITEATVQVYVERGFEYSPYHQSTRRIYRIGQQRDVHTYILIYDRSLDTLRDQNLTAKGKLVPGLVKKDFISQAEWNRIFNLSAMDDLDIDLSDEEFNFT